MSAGPQRILITGAGSGIGRALLERHANQGDNCAVMVRDDAEARGLGGLLPAGQVFAVDLARLDVNLAAAFETARECAAAMIAQRQDCWPETLRVTTGPANDYLPLISVDCPLTQRPPHVP